MKFSKEQISNVIWILAIVLIVFTPIGFHARVMVGKLFAFSADIIEGSKQQHMTSYDWSLVDLNGNRINLESNKGEVVLINLWATWCPPCVAEMPSLQKLYNDYGDRVKFLFVTEENTEKVSKFLNRKNYQLPVYFEESEIPKALFSRSIPATYIISKSGKIVVDEKGAANWNSEKIRNLLDELLAEETIF
ncbi:TlpA family protein disulfide reductase [Flagellimonas onchidii]|uniref:TlpA family protein disulfide reductase n=1 Tax=Flagellimonas onchidii TaxID=2562684 RepID=UPI0010A6838C|nr:TlpA disulfide reductase family protein [Allomuricauda onchidii]